MKKRYIAFSITAIIAVAAIVFTGCKKLNDSTDLGGGLIPPVDNINTFDTTITVQTFNDTLKFRDDSVRLGTADEFFLGRINSDPFFGATDARLFLELKPSNYPNVFANQPDSITAIDSVVLILDYVENYGDSITPQNINVYEIDQSSQFVPDSAYLIRVNNFTYSNLLGSKTVIPERLKDSVKAFGGDTTSHQLRIRLNNSFGTRLRNYDTTSNIVTGAYANDSVFRSKFKGFALQSMNSGNSIMGFDLAGANTKLAVYYKHLNKAPNIDTSVTYFVLKTVANGVPSAAANYIKRDYSGATNFLASLNNAPVEDNILYLQNTPGTYASVKIPALATISNRVVHRAELYMEQIYDPSDNLFLSPNYLYLDAADPSIPADPKFRTIPYDLNFGSSNTLDYDAFGIVPVYINDPGGNRIRTWRFNITRYVQHVLTHTQSLYELRVFPAFRLAEQLGVPPGEDLPTGIYVNGAAARGRIRIGGGAHPTQKMKLRLIYSKL